MELGQHSLEEHRDLIAYASGLGFDKLFFIGENFSKAMSGIGNNFFRDAADAESWFREHKVSGMTILLKGSRKMKMENLLNLF
jgi:UDP-N-acetylmuramoyl-tripeptide--D-alanyl-D-alanine ligase